MTPEELSQDSFKLLVAFLIKIGDQNIMDHKPEELLKEMNHVDEPGYLETLTLVQLNRYNAYIEYYQLTNQESKTTMSDEEKVAAEGAAEQSVPEAPAPAPEVPAAE